MFMTTAIAGRLEATTDQKQYLSQVVRWQLARSESSGADIKGHGIETPTICICKRSLSW
jgi:hypothetical protein